MLVSLKRCELNGIKDADVAQLQGKWHRVDATGHFISLLKVLYQQGAGIVLFHLI